MKKRRTACVWLKTSPHYRSDLFRAGLARLGYSVTDRPSRKPAPEDVIVVWNRMPMMEGALHVYDAHKAEVLVAENGYLGVDPSTGHRLFALAKRYHNGAGDWRVGGPERWAALNIEIWPWRTGGDFVLLLPQRGIGARGVAMPRTWVRAATHRLERMTKRPIRVREHPGTDKSEPYKAFKGAWAVATWGSGAALKAILHGVPAFYDLRQWIGAAAATPLDRANIEKPFLGDRLPMFQRLAWAQWSPTEIANGEAFAWLLK